MVRHKYLATLLAATLWSVQAFAQSIPGTGLGQGLLAWYKLDGNATDSSGNGLHAVLTNNVSYVPAHSGQGALFNGVNSYIDLGTPALLNLNAPMTVAAWIRRDTAGTHDDIISHGQGGYVFYVSGNSNRLSLVRQGGGCSGGIHGSVISTGEFFHVAATYANGEMRLYKNGLLSVVGSYPCSFANSRALRIGACVSFGEYFSGVIDDVRIYDRVLDDFELRCLYEEIVAVTIQTSHTSACVGGSIQMTASMLGFGQASFAWRKNDLPLSDGGAISGSDTATLTLSGVSLAEAGAYDCVATSPCGAVTSNSIPLAVIASGSGDANGDSATNGGDIQGFVNILLGGGGPSASFCACDMDQNGTVNLADVPLFANALLIP